MAKKFINIKYPFKNGPNGFFLQLNDNDADAIKSDLLHIILTRKGQRLYRPDFGTDLLKFIFEPEDGMTLTAVKAEIVTEVSKYLPQISIDNVLIEESTDTEHLAVLTINFTITDSVFQTTDTVVINL
jgi:phage baseplate assembly protein W